MLYGLFFRLVLILFFSYGRMPLEDTQYVVIEVQIMLMKINYLEFTFKVASATIDARIDYLNMLKNIKRASYTTHLHTMFEVYFIESGSLVLQCDTDEIELKEHDIFVISPNVEHRIISCSEDLKRFSFRFLFRNIPDLVSENPYQLYKPDRKTKSEIYQNISSIHFHFNDKDHNLNSFRIKNCFGTIISYIAEQVLPRESLENFFIVERSDTLTQRILIDRFFVENFSKHITIEDLAKSLNYSKTHVNRLLLKYTNKSFSQNLADTRLSIAKKFLISTPYNISKIAYKCGFSSSRGFELFFKKNTNMLPAEFRKNNQ